MCHIILVFAKLSKNFKTTFYMTNDIVLATIKVTFFLAILVNGPIQKKQGPN